MVNLTARVKHIPRIQPYMTSFFIDEQDNAWCGGESCIVGDTVGEFLPPLLFTKIEGLPPVTEVASTSANPSDGAVLARGVDGSLYSWGFGPTLGHGITGKQATPLKIPNFEVGKFVASWDARVLAIHTNGTLFSWGKGEYGSLGQGDTVDRLSPTMIPGFDGITGFEELAVGGGNCFFLKDGSVYTAGDQSRSGIDIATDILTFQMIPNLSGVQNIVANFDRAVAWNSTGLWYWGMDVGGNFQKTLPTMIAFPDGLNLSDVTIGQRHMVFLMSSGDVYVMGQDSYGNLGRGPQLGAVLIPTKLAFSGDSQVSGTRCFTHCHQVSWMGKEYFWTTSGSDPLVMLQILSKSSLILMWIRYQSGPHTL